MQNILTKTSVFNSLNSHLQKRTTYTDPRLAFAVEESNNPQEFNQRFDAYSTALGVLQGRDLSGKYAIITGANSGIGLLKHLIYLGGGGHGEMGGVRWDEWWRPN